MGVDGVGAGWCAVAVGGMCVRAVSRGFVCPLFILSFLGGYVMTLQAWCEKYGVAVHFAPSVHVYLPNDASEEQTWELHHLADYAVSSVSGPVRWMTCRSK
jgi:hypothetical protein